LNFFTLIFRTLGGALLQPTPTSRATWDNARNTLRDPELPPGKLQLIAILTAGLGVSTPTAARFPSELPVGPATLR